MKDKEKKLIAGNEDLSEWKEYKLNKIADIIMGQSPPSNSYNENNIGLPFLQGCAEFGDKNPIIKYYCSEPKKIAPENSILISVRAPVGLTNIADRMFIIGRGLASIIPTHSDLTFLFYAINQNSSRLNIVSQGSTFAAINSDELNNFQIIAPPLPIQRKIARILSTADAVIEKTQAAIAKYKAIKQGLLHDLFTRGIDVVTGKLRPKQEDAPELYKKSKLGMIPREWEVERLEKLCSMRSGEGITSTSIQEIGDYPVYGGNGLRGYTGSFTHEGEYTLIGRQGALCGNITRVKGKFYASEHAVVVTVEKEMDIDWLSQKLDTMNLNQYSEASAQPGLSVNKILKLLIVKPSFDEQTQISERLLSIDQTLRKEEAYLHKLQQIKSGLMSDLLSGRKCLNQD